MRLERFRAADPELTVSRLRKGEPVALDLYRSKQKKMELLEAALDSFDGNVITAVRVLSQSVLYDCFNAIFVTPVFSMRASFLETFCR